MKKSNIYFNIFDKLNDKTIPRELIADDLEKLFSFTKSATNKYKSSSDEKTFLDMLVLISGKINSRSKLVDNEIIFGLFLDYISYSQSEPNLNINGRRNIKNLLKYTPNYDKSKKVLESFYSFVEIQKPNGTNPPQLQILKYIWSEESNYGDGTQESIDIIKSFFIADLLWLYYHEEMGIFKILGSLMDDVYRNGSYPIPADSTAGEIIQANILLFRQGLASTLSDRESTYRRCLGWQCEDGKKLDIKSSMNENFKTAFHNFIQSALEYYNEKRVIASIQSTAAGGNSAPSINTVMNVRDTMETLKQSFDVFPYGRNLLHTAQGIINVIAGFFMIYHSREFIGVPTSGFESPDDFIPETIKRLNIQLPSGMNNTNRYIIYRNAAEYGRDLLLDIEFFDNYSDTDELKVWLDEVEYKIESYRTAVRNITGIDLAPNKQRALTT